MKLTSGQYACMLMFQTAIFWIDFSINIFGYFGGSNIAMIVLFVVQVACIILAISSLLITFFSTYVFQAGLIELLYDRFRCTLIVCVIYLILTTAMHVWTLIERWNSAKTVNLWPVGLLVVSSTQKLFSPIYYYYFKRTALRLSDPRFYVDVMWDKHFCENNVHYQDQ